MSQGSSAAMATQQAYELDVGNGAAAGRHALLQRYVPLSGDRCLSCMIPFLFLLRKPKAVKPGAAMMH